MSFLSFTIGRSSIAVFLDGAFNSIDDSHPNYEPMLHELKRPPAERDLDTIRSFLTVERMVEVLSLGRVTVFNSEIRYDDRPVDSYMTRRMIELMTQGFDLEPWAAFMNNVFDNPAEYARAELFEWMEKADMPITPDGCFLAFKKVRRDFTDCHTGRFDNSPGTLLEMDRAGCDVDRHNYCSSGFHFCSVDFLPQFGGERVVVCKINPRDVTSIPSDHQFTKGRTCRYEVIQELTRESAAYDRCWRKKGLLDLENPAELPAGILVPRGRAEPVAATATKATMTTAQVQDAIDKGGASWTAGEPVAGAMGLNPAPPAGKVEREPSVDSYDYDTTTGPAAIEEEMTDAGKSLADSQAVIDTGMFEGKRVYWAADTSPGAAKEAAPDRLALISSYKEFVFTASDSRLITITQIEGALKSAGSKRGAARALGIQESTLRGWLRKLDR